MKSAYEYAKENLMKLEPKMSYKGGDVKAWQKEAKAKFKELLGFDKLKKCDPELDIEYTTKIDGATEIRFTFQSEEGYRVPCHLLLPDGVENPPVMIMLQGHTSGMHISLGRPKGPKDAEHMRLYDRDFCVRAVKEGFATVALEQRSRGECLGPENRCFESAMTALLCGRTLACERSWDVMRLIDLLETVFADKIDPKFICLMGHSGGGCTAAYTAALEERLALAMPSGFVCSVKHSLGVYYHCACQYVPHFAEYFDEGDLIAMAAPIPYVHVHGRQDPDFRIEGAIIANEEGKKAYEALGAGDKIELVIGEAGHQFYPDIAWPVVHKFIGR